MKKGGSIYRRRPVESIVGDADPRKRRNLPVRKNHRKRKLLERGNLRESQKRKSLLKKVIARKKRKIKEIHAALAQRRNSMKKKPMNLVIIAALMTRLKEGAEGLDEVQELEVAEAQAQAELEVAALMTNIEERAEEGTRTRDSVSFR